MEITEPCPGVDELHDSLVALWDDKDISAARRSSPEADFELYRWQLARDHVTNRVFAGWRTAHPSIPGQPPSLYLDISLHDLRKLSQLPHTSIPQVEALVHERMNVEVPFARTPESAGSAALLVQLAALVFSAYLFFTIKAAAAVDALFVEGSILASLSVGTSGKLFGLCILAIPPAAAIYLALRVNGFDTLPCLSAGILIAILSVGAGIELWLASRRADRIRRSLDKFEP